MPSRHELRSTALEYTHIDILVNMSFQMDVVLCYDWVDRAGTKIDKSGEMKDAKPPKDTGNVKAVKRLLPTSRISEQAGIAFSNSVITSKSGTRWSVCGCTVLLVVASSMWANYSVMHKRY